MWFHANPRRPAGANGRIALAKGSRSRLNLRLLEQHGGGMRAVVTGGAGFLGSHLCDRLLAEGWEVLALDNLITGSETNIAHLGGNSKFRYERKDVIEPLKVGSIARMHALDLAMENNAKYLLASTSECYGDPEVSPQSESYWGRVNPVGPRSVYDEAKRFAEATTMAYHRHHHVDTHIVRIFNTYGPRMRLNDGRALPNFVYQALSGQPITVYGEGKQTRSFCYVSDLIDGIFRLSQSNEHFPTNIGNPAELTVLEFAERIRAEFPNAPKIIYEPLPEDDPKQRRPDISKAKKLLGWEPKVSLEEGLRHTLKYFKEQYVKMTQAL